MIYRHSRIRLAAIMIAMLLLLILAEACGALPISPGGPPPTPADEVKPGPGVAYIRDPFGSNVKWGNADNSIGRVSVNDDKMVIEGHHARNFVTSGLTHQNGVGDYNYGLSSWFEQGEVDLTFDTTVEQDAGSFALFGAACRFQNNNTFYAFIFQSDGKYTIQRFVNENVTRLVDVTPSTAIHTGLATNQVHIVYAGDQLQLWVNGTSLAKITDEQLKWGSVAMIGGGDNAGARITIQKLVISAPNPYAPSFAAQFLNFS